jgi:hypothetical protein
MCQIANHVHAFLDAGKTPLAGQVNATHHGLMTQDVQPLIKLLESLFGPMNARAVKDTYGATVRSILQTFWLTRKRPFLSEPTLSLIPSHKVAWVAMGLSTSSFQVRLSPLALSSITQLWKAFGREKTVGSLPQICN